jgi:hypothetical protein
MTNLVRYGLLGVGILLFVAACGDEPNEVTYRILSPTPRPRLEVTPVPTLDVNDLTPATVVVAQAPTLEPTVTATQTPTSEPTRVPETDEPATTSALPTNVPTNTPANDVIMATEETAATASLAADAPTETLTATATTQVESDQSRSGAELTPLPTSNNDALRAQQTDPNFLVQLSLEDDCFVTNEEIPVRVVARNFNENPIYLYTRGQIMFSINNSPLGPQFSPPEPSLPEDFVALELDDLYVWDFEDLGLAIQGMGPESGIDFGETFLGLPPGFYWVTAAYTNDKDGLAEQIDGTYLIPQAAWQGLGVSREERFRVVAEGEGCTAGT